jgi:hypothetical protein
MARLTVACTVASLLGWAAVWAAIAPLEQLRRQLVDGVAPAGGWTASSLLVAVAAAASAGMLIICLPLIALNVIGAALASVAPAVDALATTITPGGLRRGLFAVCGVALALPAAASAADASAACPTSHPHPGTSPVAGLALPDLPSSRPRALFVTVARGDSLWSIAGRSLPPHAPDALVAARVREMYAANRRVIGDDPDLIFPGQRLLTTGGTS